MTVHPRFNVPRLVALVCVWATCLVVGFLLHDLGGLFLRALAQVAVAGSIAAWVVTVQPPLSRSPIIRGAAAFLWMIYVAGAALLAFSLLPLFGNLPTRILAVLQLLWLGIAMLVHHILERILRSVDREVHARVVERAVVEDLREAVLRLKLGAASWPVSSRRRVIDASLREIEKAVEYGPARVPPAAESVVDEAIVCVEEASGRLQAAQDQAEEWYVAQLDTVLRRVQALLKHAESLVAMGGAR